MHNSAAEIQFRLHPTGRAAAIGTPSDAPRSTPGRLPRVTQVMALAIQLQDMIQRGDARDYADLARLGCLTRERMSQIMELVWLAPDIQQEILEFPPTERLRDSPSASWRHGESRPVWIGENSEGCGVS